MSGGQAGWRHAREGSCETEVSKKERSLHADDVVRRALCPKVIRCVRVYTNLELGEMSSKGSVIITIEALSLEDSVVRYSFFHESIGSPFHQASAGSLNLTSPARRSADRFLLEIEIKARKLSGYTLHMIHTLFKLQ